MSSTDNDIRRLEAKITDLNQKIIENERLAKRNDSREKWELDRITREFEVRRRGFETKKKNLNTELRETTVKRDRMEYQLEKEKQEELADSNDRHGSRFNH